MVIDGTMSSLEIEFEKSEKKNSWRAKPIEIKDYSIVKQLEARGSYGMLSEELGVYIKWN